MKKSLLFFLIFINLAVGALAQEDSIKVKPIKFTAYPALGSSPETGFVGGVIGFLVLKNKAQKTDGFYRPTSISPYIVYTQQKQFLSKIDVDIFTNNGININGNFRYLNFPDKFFGVGNETQPISYEEYTNQYIRVNGRIMKPKTDNLYLGLFFDMQFNNIIIEKTTSRLTQESIMGFEGGRTLGVGPSLLFDSRNSTLYPTDGHFLNLGVTAFSRAFGSEYNYMSYTLDFRKYFEFLGPKNIVAFQFRANLNSGDNIPFYKLNRLGGGERLRGIEHKNLYISSQSLFTQVEARQDLFWRLGGVIFLGMGEVFDSFSDLNIKDMRLTYGLGGRFQALKDEKLNIRLDLGFTDNGQHAFYLSVREAF
jgi:hypothetical protein